ncbi:type II secretion system protein GspL [Spongorhabdus nitratireducens]
MMNMSNNTLLVLRLPSCHEEPVIWFQSEASRGSLPLEELHTLSDLCNQNRVVVLVPGEHVTLTRLHVPGSLNQAVLKSLPWRLEEDLGSDADTVHIAVLSRKGEQLNLAVVDKHRMQQWQQWLSDAGIISRQWLPETLTLPLSEPTDTAIQPCSLLQRDDQSWLIRHGQWQGATCDDSWLALYLSDIEAEGAVEQTNIDQQSYWLQLTDLTTRQKANLLQGEWEPAREASAWTKVRKTWGISIAATVLISATWMGSTLFNTWQLNQQADAYRQQTQAIFEQTFPGKRSIRPLSQMKVALKQLRGNQAEQTDMLDHLNHLAMELQGQKTIAPVSIGYDHNRQQLRIVAESETMASFTSLRDRISAVREVRLDSLEQLESEGKNKVTGVLIIGEEKS